MSTVDFLLNLIPTTFVSAFAGGDILQVLLISILFGLALAALGEKGRPIVTLLYDVSKVFFVMVNHVSKVAPIAAFGAMAFTIGKYGLGSLVSLAGLMACVYLTCAVFIIVVLGTITRSAGFSLWKILKYIREELLIVVGTSSSEAALPGLMTKLEKAGCDKSVVGIVVPSGYSFNLDGTCIYLTMAALFIAQATDTPLSLGQQLGLLGVLLLTSKGAAGVTGSGFITLAATPGGHRHRAGGGHGAHPRRRPIPFRSTGRDQFHRQHGRHAGCGPLGTRVRPGPRPADPVGCVRPACGRTG